MDHAEAQRHGVRAPLQARVSGCPQQRSPCAMRPVMSTLPAPTGEVFPVMAGTTTGAGAAYHPTTIWGRSQQRGRESWGGKLEAIPPTLRRTEGNHSLAPATPPPHHPSATPPG